MKKKLIFLLILSVFYFLSTATVYAESFEELKTEGIAYYYQKRYEKAQQFLGEALKKQPQDKEINLYYAETLTRQLTAEVWLKRALELASQGRFNKALQALSRAEAISPYMDQLSDVREDIEDKKEELKPLEHLSETQKDEYFSYMKSGRQNLDAAKNKTAMGFFARALGLAPKSIEALEGYQESQKRYKAALYRDKLSDLFTDAVRYENQNKLVLALAKYKEVLKYDATNNQALTKAQQIEDTLDKRRRLSEKNREAKAFLDSGDRYLAAQQFIEAIEQYELGKGVFEDYIDWDKKIETAEDAKRREEEKKLEEKLKEIEINFQEGLIFLAREKFEEAIASFNLVITISKKYNQQQTRKNAEDLLKKAQENLKRKEEEQVSTESPYYDLVESLYSLGRKEFDNENYQKARRYFSNILEIFPKNKKANRYFLLCNIRMQPQMKDELLNNLLSQASELKKTDPVEANRLIDLAASIDPNDNRVKKMVKESEKTRPTYIKKSDVPQSTLDGWYRQAINQSQTNPDSSKALCQRILQEDPRYSKARTLLARIEARTNRNSWSRQRPQVNNQAKQAYATGIMHYNAGRIRRARDSFRRALQIDPGFGRARNALQKCDAYLNS